MHLSAPEGIIDKEDFTLHYSTVDDVCPDHGEVHNGQDWPQECFPYSAHLAVD